jgi:MFS family permease
MFFLHEPEKWKLAKERAKSGLEKAGSIPELFRHPTWRRNLLVGVGLGLAGMAGLWGVGFFSPELVSIALKDAPQHVLDNYRGFGFAMQDVGAFLGMIAFTAIATRWGRKPAFLVGFISCLVVTIYVFRNLRTGTDIYWMLPLMGFAQLSVFGGYAIYFPELFPTRLRGTGVAFCYNTVRYLAAAFPPMLGYFNRHLIATGAAEPFRTAATYLSFIFLLGLVALIWAPETKGKPLPEG